MRLAAGSILLELVLILSFTPLKTEIDAAAAVEGATTIETLLGSLFPYLWIFLIIAFVGVIVYDMVLKK